MNISLHAEIGTLGLTLPHPTTFVLEAHCEDLLSQQAQWELSLWP